MASRDYVRVSEHLPAVYHEQVDSFVQVDSYLGLVDELNQAILERLDDLTLTLSPGGPLRWPGGLPLDAGQDAVLDSYVSLLDGLAEWFAYRFPVSWSVDETGIEKRRAFLSKAARFWRRRGTPRGFLDWFCFAFDIAPADRPFLLEHFKVDGPPPPDPGLKATLFVPSTTQFSDYQRRREAIAFVERYAPSHVLMRVCWAPPGFEPPVMTGTLAAYREALRDLLCDVVSFIDHEIGIRIWECIDEGRSVDRLGIGRLPTI